METATDGWKRASTDWFHDAGRGVFCHFCFHSPPEMSAEADALSEKGGRIPREFMAHLRAIGAPATQDRSLRRR